ncbi:MAG: hypothetical protein ACO3AF_06055 [Flavobacteriales bacterium]
MQKPRFFIALFVVFFYAVSWLSVKAQHSIGVNAGAGPSFQYGGTPFFSTSIEYQFRFKMGLTVGGNVGLFSNQELRMVPNGNRLLGQLAPTIAAQAGYDFPMGIMLPFVRLDLGAALANRESFFMQPMIGNEVKISNRIRCSLAFQVPIFFMEKTESGLVMTGGLRYVFTPKKGK